MNSPVNVQELERALMSRAQTLAEEYLERARRSRDRIVSEENERLRLREEREVLAAKALAERTFRRQVQHAELEMQESLDRLRWELIGEVLAALPERLAEAAKDEASYLPMLSQMLAQSAKSIEQGDLVCEVNAADLKRLQGGWEQFAKAAVPDRTITLAPSPCDCIGGLLLRTADDRIRVDNTFEGRLQRLEETLQRVIIDRLFASVVHRGAMFNG